MFGPGGRVHAAFVHRGGDDSYEETQTRPLEFQVVRVDDDLSFETFLPGITPEPARLIADSRGRIYVVGANEGLLHLWRLDPDNGYRVIGEWPLPGTQQISKSLPHTLRPERFGGEGDGDTVHLVASDSERDKPGTKPHDLQLWYARFELPVGE